MKRNIIIYSLLLIVASNGFCQTGGVYETYKQPNWQGDSNSSTIFQKPFQEYNYRKSSRGIEVYKTYFHTNVFTVSTNIYLQSGQTIFSRSEPDFIIKNNGQIYKTYSYSTNRGSIFTKPFQSKSIDTSTKGKISFDGETLSGE